MSVHAVISSTGHRRIHFAQRWLENRAAAEEVLIVGATLDAANELARKVAKKKGAAFGWHRLALPQLAFAVAAPTLAARGLTPLSRIGVAALVARLVHRMNAEGRLSHYRSVVTTPGFPRAVAGVITELRLARISLDAIGACAPDLERLIGAFETELKEAGVTDWPGVLSLASEAASGVGGNRPRLTGLPTLFLDVPAFLVIDDTTLPKKGTHSVGVAPQYASALGKTANCQTLVSLTLARGEVPVMVGLRLFLPETWTGDEAQLERAGVPAEYRSARAKSEIALAELDRLIAAGVRFGTERANRP